MAIVLFRSLEVSRIQNTISKQPAPVCPFLNFPIDLRITQHSSTADLLEAIHPKTLQDFYDAPLTWSVLPLICARFLAIGIGSLLVGERHDSVEKQSCSRLGPAQMVPRLHHAFWPCAPAHWWS